MSLVVMSARVHADNVDAVTAEAHRTFAAIAAARPDVGYAVYRTTDGATFVTILDLPDENNPLFSIAAFVEFQHGLRAWVAEQPTSEVWEVVASYRLFGRADERQESMHSHYGSQEDRQRNSIVERIQ
jgi:hypothetical protein